jgi:hypothetical protein
VHAMDRPGMHTVAVASTRACASPIWGLQTDRKRPLPRCTMCRPCAVTALPSSKLHGMRRDPEGMLIGDYLRDKPAKMASRFIIAN